MLVIPVIVVPVVPVIVILSAGILAQLLPIHFCNRAGNRMDFAFILHVAGNKLQVIFPIVQAALHEFGFRQPKVGQGQFFGALHANVAAAPR